MGEVPLHASSGCELGDDLTVLKLPSWVRGIDLFSHNVFFLSFGRRQFTLKSVNFIFALVIAKDELMEF